MSDATPYTNSIQLLFVLKIIDMWGKPQIIIAHMIVR